MSASRPKIQVDELTEVFESLSMPLAVCDPDGVVVMANSAAWHMLDVPAQTHVRLVLDDRETLAAMRLTGGQRTRGKSLEFFLADVTLEGAGIRGVAASIAPLDSGGFRVSFVEQREQEVSPATRLFKSMGSVHEHVALFDEMQEVLPLFGSSLQDIFLECMARIEICKGSEVAHAWTSQGEGEPSRVMQRRPLLKLEPEQMLWHRSTSGTCVWYEAGGIRCGMQLETRRAGGLSVMEREAAALFVHVVGFFAQRLMAQASSERSDWLVPVLDELEAGVALCDARRIIRSCNESFVRAMGQDMDALCGEDALRGFDEETASALRGAAATVLSGAVPEAISARVPGYDMQVSVRVVPLQEVMTGELASQRGFLLLVQPMARSLAAAVDKIEQAEHLLQVGQLASGVAHELKNPMTSILNYADYLLQKYRGHLFEQRDSERLVRIIEGVERMDVFIKDLVLLARPASEHEVAGRVNVHDVVTQSRHLCALQLEQHGAHLQCELHAGSPCVWGVSNLLVQVFVNLLSNAAAALPEAGGSIRLTTAQDASYVVCEVKDDGCGMNEETLSRIFEPFYTRRRNTGGSGLGLPLVRTLVERHDGKISVTSRPGEGTTVRLELPLYSGVPQENVEQAPSKG